jgi:hypothetical protein
MFGPIEWRCEVCGRTRPDHLIGVDKKDVSAHFNLPPGTMMNNIKYCVDNATCRRVAFEAKDLQEVRQKPKAG